LSFSDENWNSSGSLPLRSLPLKISSPLRGEVRWGKTYNFQWNKYFDKKYLAFCIKIGIIPPQTVLV